MLCPTCGQPVGPDVPLKRVPDEAILKALRGGEPSRKGGLIPHILYAAADRHNSRLADLERWYVTGPPERLDYIKGPFPREQVKRLVRAGYIKPEVTADNGEVHAYVLR